MEVQSKKSIQTLKNSIKCPHCSKTLCIRNDYVRHMDVHSLKTSINEIIVKGRQFCVCCLTCEKKLIEGSQGMLFYSSGESTEIAIVDMLNYFIPNINTTDNQNKICEDCLSMTLKTYLFLKKVEKTTKMFTKVIKSLEKEIQSDKLIPKGKIFLNINADDILRTNHNFPMIFKDKDPFFEKENDKKVNLCLNHESDNVADHSDDDKILSKMLHEKKSKLKVKKLEKTVNSKKFICSDCNKEFKTKKLLKIHIKNEHLNIECKECKKKFKKLTKYKNHRCIFKCAECFKNCIHKKYLDAFKEGFQRKSLRKCVDCNFMYVYKYQLLEHVNKEHLNHLPHLCDLCGDSFAAKKALKYHREHTHQKSFKCCYCNKVFKENSTLCEHLKLCITLEKPFSCDKCDVIFPTEGKANFHRRKHFSKDFQCDFCSKRYWTKSELNSHLKITHKGEISVQKTFKKVYNCSMCTSTFSSKKHLSEHLATHPTDSKHICRTCNASYKSKINYYAHIRCHKLQKDCKCSICGKFYNKYNIKTHLKNHEKEKDAKEKQPELEAVKKTAMCDLCGKLLSNEKTLTKHREIHKEQEQCQKCLKYINISLINRHKCNSLFNKGRKTRKNFNCDKCNYTSFFQECLEAHINRFHLKIRPFKCDICCKGFYAKLTLKEHIKIHSGAKPEQCEICGNRFVNKKALRLHKRLHTGERPYKCDLCDERFLSASRRQAHRVRKHFEPTVQCSLCLRMYYTQSSLRTHVKDCHSGDVTHRIRKKKV